MSCRSSTSLPSPFIYWVWKANSDPFASTEPTEWRRYSDIENAIIEEAYDGKKSHALLDDYHIDLQQCIQILNNDFNKQRPVKRITGISEERKLREARFLPDPVAPKHSFSQFTKYSSVFLDSVADELPYPIHTLGERFEHREDLVEKAAQGLVEEGKKVGKQREAEYMAQKLLEKRNASLKEIWECCAHLYTLESFLYKKINETMRLIGSKEHEYIWRSKVTTFGPFCLLLSNTVSSSTKHITINDSDQLLYRGANLSDEMIASYSTNMGRRSFQGFTSTSRSRARAEEFGNVLFIMKIITGWITNMSPYSDYPHEEEELIPPGSGFIVERVEFDKAKGKHLIYIKITGFIDGS